MKDEKKSEVKAPTTPQEALALVKSVEVSFSHGSPPSARRRPTSQPSCISR